MYDILPFIIICIMDIIYALLPNTLKAKLAVAFYSISLIAVIGGGIYGVYKFINDGSYIYLILVIMIALYIIIDSYMRKFFEKVDNYIESGRTDKKSLKFIKLGFACIIIGAIIPVIIILFYFD